MRLIDAEIAYDKIAEQETSYYMDMEGVQAGLDETPTVDAIPLDTKIVIQTYNEEHEEWTNEIMTIQEFLDSGMCEIYREELRDQYEQIDRR